MLTRKMSVCKEDSTIFLVRTHIHTLYAWTCKINRKNTKTVVSSPIMKRFQRFLVFWKAENLLFRLETTVLRDCVFLVEKNNVSLKIVEDLLNFSSLNILDFAVGELDDHQNSRISANTYFYITFLCYTLTEATPYQFWWPSNKILYGHAKTN